MQNDQGLTAQQKAWFKYAVTMTQHQLSQARALLAEANLQDDPAQVLAITQILATNYAAEVHRKV